MFRISKLGYKKAYILAVRYFSELNKLTSSEKLMMIARIPELDVFTDHLFGQCKERGHSISLAKLNEKLAS